MLSKFDYYKPNRLDDAIGYLSDHPGTRILAGGTDLMILLRRNLITCDHILDIKSIPETHRFECVAGEGLFIGASVTVNEISESDVIQKDYPAIKEAADALASYQLRNRATLVGNICNASPGADLAGPLLVYDAVIHIAGPNGQRAMPIHEFFVGVKKIALLPEELVIGITLPEVKDGDISTFMKQARIKGHDLGIAATAVRLTTEGKYAIAMTAVAPTPIRLSELEKQLISLPKSQETAEWAQGQVQNHIRPISDVRSSAEYRLHISGVLVKRALNRLNEKGGM
jgi:carbon-monoxide dehydrogenase medium subunit